MNPRQRILKARINTYLGGLLIFSFGLFVLTIGFNLSRMVNPIADALTGQISGSTL